MILTVHEDGSDEPVLAYEVPDSAEPAALEALDAALRQLGAAPLAMLDLDDPDAVSPSEANAAWLGELPELRRGLGGA